MRWGPSSASRPASLAGEPISNLPAGTTTISGHSAQSRNASPGFWAAPGFPGAGSCRTLSPAIRPSALKSLMPVPSSASVRRPVRPWSEANLSFVTLVRERLSSLRAVNLPSGARSATPVLDKSSCWSFASETSGVRSRTLVNDRSSASRLPRLRSRSRLATGVIAALSRFRFASFASGARLSIDVRDISSSSKLVSAASGARLVMPVSIRISCRSPVKRRSPTSPPTPLVRLRLSLRSPVSGARAARSTFSTPDRSSDNSWASRPAAERYQMRNARLQDVPAALRRQAYHRSTLWSRR